MSPYIEVCTENVTSGIILIWGAKVLHTLLYTHYYTVFLEVWKCYIHYYTHTTTLYFLRCESVTYTIINTHYYAVFLEVWKCYIRYYTHTTILYFLRCESVTYTIIHTHYYTVFLEERFKRSGISSSLLHIITTKNKYTPVCFTTTLYAVVTAHRVRVTLTLTLFHYNLVCYSYCTYA